MRLESWSSCYKSEASRAGRYEAQRRYGGARLRHGVSLRLLLLQTHGVLGINKCGRCGLVRWCPSQLTAQSPNEQDSHFEHAMIRFLPVHHIGSKLCVSFRWSYSTDAFTIDRVPLLVANISNEQCFSFDIIDTYIEYIESRPSLCCLCFSQIIVVSTINRSLYVLLLWFVLWYKKLRVIIQHGSPTKFVHTTINNAVLRLG